MGNFLDQTTPAQLRTIPSPEMKQDYSPSRADVVREASKRVPLNGLSLPEGFHRADLLHPHSGVVKKVVPQEDLLRSPQNPTLDLSKNLYTDDGPLLILDEKIVRAAYVPLDYREGFPTIPTSGCPFWAQLEYEPNEAFRSFEHYLKQGKDEGARRLFSLACIPEVQQLCLGSAKSGAKSGAIGAIAISQSPQLASSSVSGQFSTNSLAESDEEQAFLRERELSTKANRQLQEWFTLYYWGPRARAHDLFYLDGIRQAQGMQALQLQNDHFRDSQKLYHQVMDFIEGNNEASLNGDGVPRFWAEMTPRVLVDFLKVTTQMARLSLGLPGGTPADITSPNSAIGILNSLINGSGSPGSLGSLGGSGGTRRGRPSISYDENNNPISSNEPLSSSGLRGAGSPGSGNGNVTSRGVIGATSISGSEITDEERTRRITMLMNSAKARREANRSGQPAASTASTASTE